MVGFALWLDVQAALTGQDSGAGLLRAHMSNDLFPASMPLAERRPSYFIGTGDREMEVVTWGKESLTVMSKLGALALSMRSEQHSPHESQAAQQVLLGRQRIVRQFQIELYEHWGQLHPASVPREHPVASGHLPTWTRYVYDSVSGDSFGGGFHIDFADLLIQGFLTLSICAMYSNTSMFSGQLLRNAGARPEVERHCQNVLDMAESIFREGASDPRVTGFALFLAGYSATDYDTKIRAINLLQALEGRGISRNAKRGRALLIAVCEEQRQRVLAGGRAEEVDWLVFARARNMETLDFGL